MRPYCTVYIIGQQDLIHSLAFAHSIPSWLIWAEIQSALYVGLPKRPKEWVQLVQQSIQKPLRAYCPNIYTVPYLQDLTSPKLSQMLHKLWE